MVKCRDCGKKRKTNANAKTRVICWEDYQLCSLCCVKKHPERYPLNVINQILGTPVKATPKVIKYCLLCNDIYYSKGYCKYHYYHVKRKWKEERN